MFEGCQCCDELLRDCHEVCLRYTLRLQHVKQPRKILLLQCLQHWSLTIAERVGHCIADAWASSSCERTVYSQVCACSIDFYDNNITLPIGWRDDHVDNDHIRTRLLPAQSTIHNMLYGYTTQLQRTTRSIYPHYLSHEHT